MSKTLTILAVILLSGCGQASGPQDPAFIDIVAQFTQDALNRGIVLQVDTTIQFGDVAANNGTSEAVAVCNKSHIDAADSGTITVDQVHWNGIAPLEQKMLIYHELGHCVLNRVHVMATEQELIYPGISATETLPLSIMYPQSPDEGQLNLGGLNYQTALVNEMFGQ